MAKYSETKCLKAMNTTDMTRQMNEHDAAGWEYIGTPFPWEEIDAAQFINGAIAAPIVQKWLCLYVGLPVNDNPEGY